MPFCHLDLITIPAEIPSDPDERASFCQLVTDLLANPKAKPGTYRHHGVPLVHHAVRTRNLAALQLLGRGGVDLNKPFRDVVDGTPAAFTLTALEEAMLREESAPVSRARRRSRFSGSSSTTTPAGGWRGSTGPPDG
ncbi:MULTISPECIES: hypothetical protein [Burkholderia]|uniref:hypothetical protein n=1 Tax=Burkholderia TaxID=32008 RepID=UPI000CFF29D4|nr:MULTISPECIES: hypothetical protein [Burkholderia]MDR8057682.1 hypothetical protein [Burkholderia cenocepacia]MDR8062226.1 hypothetical protein [Burkholderia cenocepacia]PRE81330.1 hypothetical protein C6Q13_25080 [Burkholderia gladioli]